MIVLNIQNNVWIFRSTQSSNFMLHKYFTAKMWYMDDIMSVLVILIVVRSSDNYSHDWPPTTYNIFLAFSLMIKRLRCLLFVLISDLSVRCTVKYFLTFINGYTLLYSWPTEQKFSKIYLELLNYNIIRF